MLLLLHLPTGTACYKEKEDGALSCASVARLPGKSATVLEQIARRGCYNLAQGQRCAALGLNSLKIGAFCIMSFSAAFCESATLKWTRELTPALESVLPHF